MSVATIPRARIRSGLWDQFVEQQHDGWFFHTEGWIDYAMAYAPGSSDESVAFLRDGDIVAVLPSVRTTDGRWTFGGQPSVPLLTTDDAMVEHDMFAPGLKVAWRPGTDDDDVPVPTNGVLSRNETYVVDLWDGDEIAHWRRLRKSYRSLIHQAEGRCEISAISGPGDRTLAAVETIAQNLHIAAAGRRTRSQETWRLMAEWALAGRGLIVLAREQSTQTYIGFAYAIRWKEWSYWMSGATLQRNLQHALQWHMIKALMCDGETRYYEVGHAATHADVSDDKAKNIAWFKSGFGGTRWVVPMVEGQV